MDGEVLSFDVIQPYPKHDITYDKAKVPIECKLLFVIENRQQIVGVSLGENHAVIVGANGNCYWLGFPIRVKKIKPIEVASKKKGKAKPSSKVEIVVDEWEPIDPNDYKIIDEIHLAIGVVTSMQYRKDKKQLLLGSSKNIITTIDVNAEEIQILLETKAKHLDSLVKVAWQSRFHDGPILAMSTIKLVTNNYYSLFYEILSDNYIYKY